MKMTSEQFWEEEFGDRNEAHDFAGRLVHKNKYGVRAEYGWTVDHILPLSMNGPDKWENVQITHFRTNEEKLTKIPLFRMKNIFK
jgi:5-methylcytosine-specific restriction endonuclease McrA